MGISHVGTLECRIDTLKSLECFQKRHQSIFRSKVLSCWRSWQKLLHLIYCGLCDDVFCFLHQVFFWETEESLEPGKWEWKQITNTGLLASVLDHQIHVRNPWLLKGKTFTCGVVCEVSLYMLHLFLLLHSCQTCADQVKTFLWCESVWHDSSKSVGHVRGSRCVLMQCWLFLS